MKRVACLRCFLHDLAYTCCAGGNDFEKGVEFIKSKFFELNRNEKKKIFAHVTCATDTQNIKVVFEDAKEIIISQNLERLGFGPV